MPGTTTLRPSRPAPPMTGVLGDSRPCGICYQTIPMSTPAGEIKRLAHCDVTVHVSCLKEYWNEQVRMACSTSNVRCPGVISGCTSHLFPGDIAHCITSVDIQRAEDDIARIQRENEELIQSITSQYEKDVAVFECAICMCEHPVDGISSGLSIQHNY